MGAGNSDKLNSRGIPARYVRVNKPEIRLHHLKGRETIKACLNPACLSLTEDLFALIQSFQVSQTYP